MFSVGTQAITTYNPNSHEITNQVCRLCERTCHSCHFVIIFCVQWAYNEFAGIQASSKASNEFIITLKKKGTISSERKRKREVRKKTNKQEKKGQDWLG